MHEEKIKPPIKEEINKSVINIHNDLKKTEQKPAHPIVYISWIAIVVAFLYLMYKAYVMTK